MRHFDVVILGAGSAGELIATTLARTGRSVALIERLRVGGECAYVSCMPSKAMLRSAQIRNTAKRTVELGATVRALELDGESNAFRWAAARRDRISEYRDDSGAAASAIEDGVVLLRGNGYIAGPNLISINEDVISWSDLVIATGSEPSLPKIKGLETIDPWMSDDALSVKDCPKSILIVGGGPVGCELAQVFARFGSETTLVQKGAQLASMEHPDIAARLCDILKDDGVNVLLKTEVIEFELCSDKQTRAYLSDGSNILVEKVIIASGRQPNTATLGLGILDVEVEPSGAVRVDEHCRVLGQENIWAAGDVTGVAPFTHTANYQGRIVLSNLMGMEQKANYDAIPRAIYTDPPLASVGRMADLKNQEGLITASFDLDDLSRTATDGSLGGLLVLTADPVRGVLVGASAIGPGADEWLAEATLAIRAEIQLSLLCDVVHAFPTYGEAFERPLRDLHRQVLSMD